MTIEEAFTWVSRNRPGVLHISGKTSTGKSTFAEQLESRLGYAVVECDEMVYKGVIEPLELDVAQDVVAEVYKRRVHLDWVARFVTFTAQSVGAYMAGNQPVVLDGAIANPVTLRELLAPYADAEILYFHPVSLPRYENRIRQRLLAPASSPYARLPRTFWVLVDEEAMEQYRTSHTISPSIEAAITSYALASQKSSKERLQTLKRDFPDIIVVEV